jgi:predicted flap endonuclease-1-like 5' DNA nuclease
MPSSLQGADLMRIAIEIDTGGLATAGCYPRAATVTFAPVSEVGEVPAARGAPVARRGGTDAGPIPFVGDPAVAGVMATRTGSAPIADLPADDLTLIRGIGPAIAEVLARAGITTYAQLAASRPDWLRRVLTDAQLAARVESWPEQGKLAAEGGLERLRALQALRK